MKAILIMFDTLNRQMLPPYGCKWIHAPNFERLASRTVTFQNAYVGSIEYMPQAQTFAKGIEFMLSNAESFYRGGTGEFRFSRPLRIHQMLQNS